MCKRPLPWVHAAYTQSLRKAQPQRWFSLYIFFFVLYLSVGSLPPKRAVKKHNTKLKLSYIFGKLEAELAGRKRKSPVVCVSVFVVFFFYFVFSSPAISVVPPLPQSASQSTSQQLKLCLSLFFIGVFQYCCISIVVLM